MRWQAVDESIECGVSAREQLLDGRSTPFTTATATNQGRTQSVEYEVTECPLVAQGGSARYERQGLQPRSSSIVEMDPELSLIHI